MEMINDWHFPMLPFSLSYGVEREGGEEHKQSSCKNGFALAEDASQEEYKVSEDLKN